MTEERTEILRLLADGKIDVDAAHRLLEAAEEGQRRRRQQARSGLGRGQQAIQEALTSVKDTVAGIGPMIGRIAGEIGAEFQKERTFPGENEAEELPDQECEGNTFPIAEGKKLFIRSDKGGEPGGGELCLVSVDGDRCELEGDQIHDLRVLASASGPVIRWTGGLLKVKIPSTVAEVFAHTLTGNAQVDSLPCPIQIKSMGGDLHLVGLTREFKVKTMGGNIRIGLGPGSTEPCEASTMGGNIRVEVSENTLRTETEAVTTGGSILIDDDLGRTKKGGYPGRQRIDVWLGRGEDGSTLKVKTMGGNIEIRKAADEPHE